KARAILVFCQEPYSLKWHFWQDFEPTYFGSSARGQAGASDRAVSLAPIQKQTVAESPIKTRAPAGIERFVIISPSSERRPAGAVPARRRCRFTSWERDERQAQRCGAVDRL